MHCEYSAYSNPRCTLRAAFVRQTFHSPLCLSRARKRRTRSPTKRTSNKVPFNEKANRNAVDVCEMTGTYLRGVLSACSGVMAWNSSSAASARVAIPVAMALQPVNTSEASRCQLRERGAV